MTHSDSRFFGIPERHALALLLFAAVLMAPAFLVPSGASDIPTQVLWVKLFSAQIWHGDWYPRWLEDMYAGAGSPVFFYYPPLTYFITALFAPPVLAGHEYQSISASGLLAVFISGITFYRMMAAETGRSDAALVGSLLYMAGPAHLAHSFYFAMLFSTVWVYALVPQLMASAKRASLGGSREVALFAFSLALLILTNLPETVIWGPIAVLYALIQLRSPCLSQLVRIGGSVLLGFAMSAAYLLPAVCYLHYSIIKRQWSEADVDYHNFFMNFEWWGTLQGVYLYVWLLLFGLAALYWVTAHRRVRDTEFFAFVSVCGLYMIMPDSVEIWDQLTILRIVQFPLRLFIIPTLGVACLASYAWPRFRLLAGVLVFGYIAITVLAALWPREADPRLKQFYDLNIEQHANYLTSYDLVPRYYSIPGIEDVKKHMSPVEVISGKVAVDVLEWKPRHIVLGVHAAERSVFRVRQFYFSGVKVLPRGSVIRHGREGKTGFILIDVPPGDAQLTVELGELPPEEEGQFISLISGLVTLLLFVAKYPGKKAPVAEAA